MAAMTMSGTDCHRMEQKRFEYFSSMNSMARKIMLEREKIKESYGAAWQKMTPNEQDTAIDNGMMDPNIRARYAMHRVDREEVICYPRLLIQTGQKIVHFGEEDLTWQDEHSAPFSWETKSQLEFSLTSAPSEQPVTSAPSSSHTSSTQADPKPSKPIQNNQLPKGTANNKVSNGEGPSLGNRQEEESSFWKITAERSRMDGEKADFLSLTPSQIKSLEKGEKQLPSYLRPETPSSTYLRSETPSPAPKEPDEPPPQPKATKQRAPRPPAPPPPIPVPIAVTPAAISTTPSSAPISVSSTVAGWERAGSTLPSVSNAPDEVFNSGMPGAKSSARSGREGDKAESPPLASSPTFAQFNTSSNILKTGFDFLDNW